MRAMCTRSSHKQNEMIALSIIATQIQRRNGAQGRSLIFCHTSGGLLFPSLISLQSRNPLLSNLAVTHEQFKSFQEMCKLQISNIGLRHTFLKMPTPYFSSDRLDGRGTHAFVAAKGPREPHDN